MSYVALIIKHLVFPVQFIRLVNLNPVPIKTTSAHTQNSVWK